MPQHGHGLHLPFITHQMKISKEVRIGILVLISVFIFFAGFYFLKGSSIFNREYTYYAYYDNVQGLQISSPVQIKGFNVGKVADIDLNGTGQVKVTLAVNRKTHFPSNTVAVLTSTDLLGTKGISLELGNSTTQAEDDATLKSEKQSGLIDAISSEVNPLLKDVRHAIGIVDSILYTIDNTLNEQTRVELQQSVTSLHHAMTNFESISNKLNAQGDQLAGAIRNANSVTANLAANNQRIDSILANLDHLSGNLRDAPVQETITQLQETSKQLNEVMTKINTGQGSIGMAVNDPKLYNDLNGALTNLQTLLADINKHPSRYINITIFGRKAKVGTD